MLEEKTEMTKPKNVIELEDDIRSGLKWGLAILAAKWLHVAFLYFVRDVSVLVQLVDIVLLSVCLGGFHFKNTVASSLTFAFLSIAFFSDLIYTIVQGRSPALFATLFSFGVLLIILQGVVATYRLKNMEIPHNQAL